MLDRNNTARFVCRFLLLTWVLVSAPVGLAADAGAESDIRVRANYMRFDIETGSSVYQGDVKITHGKIELYGEKVIIRRQNDEIQQITVDGRPARYTQDENTENSIHATSQHMQYLTNEQQLVMTVNARLQQPDHTIESQRIVYDTKNKIVIAGSEKNQDQQNGRVNIILTPKKDSSPSAPAPSAPAPAGTEKP